MAAVRWPMKARGCRIAVTRSESSSDLVGALTVAGGFRVRAVERADGVDVDPRHVTAGEEAGDGRSLTGELGDEADARAGDLVGVHLLCRLHALAVGDAGVVERT